jgi:hypothetical protein
MQSQRRCRACLDKRGKLQCRTHLFQAGTSPVILTGRTHSRSWTRRLLLSLLVLMAGLPVVILRLEGSVRRYETVDKLRLHSIATKLLMFRKHAHASSSVWEWGHLFKTRFSDDYVRGMLNNIQSSPNAVYRSEIKMYALKVCHSSSLCWLSEFGHTSGRI